MAKTDHLKFVLGIGTAATIGVIGATYFYNKVRKNRRQAEVYELIPELNQSNVFIKDREKIEAVILQILQAGKDKLQVITDFDHTLSKYSWDGRIIPTCHGILETSVLLPLSFREKAVKLKEKYYPIEFCHEMTNAEKYPYMVECNSPLPMRSSFEKGGTEYLPVFVDGKPSIPIRFNANFRQ